MAGLVLCPGSTQFHLTCVVITASVRFAPPTPHDAASMWRLAAEVGLDQNSPHHYFLFCRDFARTSIVAHGGHDLVGFATGYRRPDSPRTLFVWQIVVSAGHRRRGLALAMLEHLRDRVRKDGVRCLEASVTGSNHASRRLFQSFADASGASCAEGALFAGEGFPASQERESLLRIAPL